ncbi:MAG: glycoside hydrolase family 5 protein [Candidatus Margulisbacteria bacterium]|jgi:endoglucanase|nr:glycoside hydrolase family 5 protein [Candidatus Margulisiibacteriota bacterium]
MRLFRKYLKAFGGLSLVVILLLGCGKTEKNISGKDPPSRSDAKYLLVDGNKIKYGNNTQGFQEVILRGVNVGDPYHLGSSGGFTTPNYTEIRNALKANAVRIAVHSRFWTENKTSVLNCLKGNVQKALAAGLFVIIDYHTIAHPVDGSVNSYDGLYSADFDKARDFWTTIASQPEFSDGRILFELWNEPFSDNYNPNAYTSNWGILKAKWQILIDIIRAPENNKRNIIIASGQHWTFDLRGIKGDPLPDSNIAYAWHTYTGLHAASTWAAALDELQNTKPVLVTEWGFEAENSRAGSPDTDWTKLRGEFLQGKNLHSFAWAFCGWYTPNMLSDDHYYSSVVSFTESLLNSFGREVVDYLKYHYERGEQIFP